MELIYGLCLVMIQTYLASGGGPDPTSPCQPGEINRLPHPDGCQLYYDCSMETQPADYLDKYVAECTYPQLFDTETMTCQPYNQVTCGDRPEPVNGCEYLANQCLQSSHCRPCYIDFPECKNLPDGPNPIAHKPETPYFAICQDGRFITEMKCPKDQRKQSMIFNPLSKICVPK